MDVKPNDVVFIVTTTRVTSYNEELVTQTEVLNQSQFDTKWGHAKTDPKVLRFVAYRIHVPSAAVCTKESRTEVFDARKEPPQIGAPPKEGPYR